MKKQNTFPLYKFERAFTKNHKCLIPVKPFLETATGHEQIHIPVDDFEQFLRDKSSYEKKIGCPLRADLTGQEVETLLRVVGSTKKSDLKNFLVNLCGVKSPEFLDWTNILALLHRYSSATKPATTTTSTGLSFDAGSVLYNGRRLDVPSGLVEILDKLYTKMPSVVDYSALDEASKKAASQNLKTYISRLNKILKKAKTGYTINNHRGNGYFLKTKI